MTMVRSNRNGYNDRKKSDICQCDISSYIMPVAICTMMSDMTIEEVIVAITI